MDHFKNLCWICYSIASVLCFGFLAWRHVWSPWPGIEACTPYIGMQNLYHWTRVVPGLDSWQHFLCQEMEPEHSPASMWPSCPGLQKLWGHLEVLEGQCPSGHGAHAGFFLLFFGLLKDLYPPPSPKSNFPCVLLCLKPTPFSGLPCFPAVTDVNWVKRAIWCPGGKRGWPVGLFCIRPVLFILHGVPGLRQTVQLGTCPAFLRNCHLHLPRWVLWIWGTRFTQDLLLLLMLHT